jgi:hypothetical protein
VVVHHSPLPHLESCLQAATMNTMLPNNVEGATDTRAEDTNRENEQINVPKGADTEIAAELSHSKTEASDEDDVLHDLRDSFSRTASLGKRPDLRRNNSGSGTSRPMAPRRVQSMNARHGRSVGRTKSSDLSTMPTLLQQGNPRPSLQRPSAPQRTKSSSGSKTFNRVKPVRTSSDSLRTMRRDQLVNTALERKESPQSLLRGSSGTSVATFSDLDSCFTMDSAAMRKQQLIADPLDDGTYCETDSAADHDDSLSHFSEYPAEPRELTRYVSGDSLSHLKDGGGSIATFCTFDSHRLGVMQIHNGVDQDCDISLFSNNSFSTLNTADVALDLGDISIMDDEAGLYGLDDLDELGESDLCDHGELGPGELKELEELQESNSNVSFACVSIESNAANVD